MKNSAFETHIFTNIHEHSGYQNEKRKSFLKSSNGIFLLVSSVILALLLNASSSLPAFDEATLTTKAIEVANEAGLIGTPKKTRAEQMDLGDWLTLIEVDLGLDAAKFGLTSDMPVFILAIRGEVEWNGHFLQPPGEDVTPKYDNITVVLDASTGEPLWVASKEPGYPMPVSVP